MTTISLPKSTLDQLDRLSRSFLWGSTVEKKRQHLIGWDRVCLSKAEGGLGIRKSQQMNKSLLAKLGWRLLNDRTSLWARVLRSKYRVGDAHDSSWTVSRGTWSSTWRSIGVGLREVIFPGLRWVIGNGRETLFWADKWISVGPIGESTTNPIPENYKKLRVCDFWKNGSGWDMDRISPYVTERVRLMLTSVVVDTVTGSPDRLSWGGSSDGCFTVKSAYSMLTANTIPVPHLQHLFDRIWRVTAHERVKVFIWLVLHQVVMTNVERHRRHLADSELCLVCKGGAETIIHVLRDCPAMAGVWNRLVPTRNKHRFFTQTLLEWIYGNLGDESIVHDVPWAILFAQAVWWGWKWRCGNVFGVQGKCRDRIRFLKDLSKEVLVAHNNVVQPANQRPRVERLIAWKPPMDGWMKLNTDGASHGNPGAATAGGVLRNESGTWCGGFALNIGICSAPLAELWGVYYGLYIAWEKGIRRLELEVDSEIVVGFLNRGISDSHPLSFLVRLCYGFISKDWIVRISHVYREANRLADGLANYAFSLPLGFHACHSIPDSVVSISVEDVSGPARPREIRL